LRTKPTKKSENQISKSAQGITMMNIFQKNKELCDDAGSEVVVTNEAGDIVISCNEISSVPSDAYMLNTSDSAVRRAKHLAADLFKGSQSIPNKTIEVVFKKEIQNGLNSGTYTMMKTKSGEVHADAVNSKGRTVGKGRVIQSGKVKQLAAGAFQLISIAVAQSHLADIEDSLDTIRNSIAEILNKLENEDKANISGAIDYLQEIAEHIKNQQSSEELSQQKTIVIEAITRDFYTWRNKLHEDFHTLTYSVINQKDADKFGGTKSTYKQLREAVEKSRTLVIRHKLLIQLACVTNYITAYLDPTKKKFTRIDINMTKWDELVENFKESVISKSNELLSKALFNSNEMLTFRREKIHAIASDQYTILQSQKNEYENRMQLLQQNLNRFIGQDGDVHIALSFGQEGEVVNAAII
jgi:hypothetical protein